MQYKVLGSDGAEYGPVDLAVLSQWAREGRLARDTQVTDVMTGTRTSAGMIPGVFAASPPPQPGPPPTSAPFSAPSYSQPPQPVYMSSNSGTQTRIGVVLAYCGGALLMFFVLGGFGIIFAGYAVYHAFQANSDGDRYGVLGIVASLITILLVGVGWILRVSNRVY